MKKISIVILLALAVTLSACGKSSQTENRDVYREEQETEQLKEPSETEVSVTEKDTGVIMDNSSDTEKSTDNSDGLPEAYAEILSLYASALTERWDGGTLMEHDMNYMLADCYGDNPFQNVGYAIVDLDENGSRELLIGATANIGEEFFRDIIFELYTLDDNGNAIRIFISGERDRYYYAGSMLFAHVGSSSASDSLETTERLENGTLTDLESVTDPSEYKQMEFNEISL